MKPSDFITSVHWKRERDEIRLEILAVLLPVLIYSVAVAIGHFGLAELVGKSVKLPPVIDLLKIPDALFGACILFAFSLIHGFSMNSNGIESNIAAWAAIRRWRERALAGFATSILMSGAAVIFKPYWALPVGLALLYVSALAYKKVCFHRAFLRVMAD